MPVNLSYPKPRATQTKIFAVARTDSATQKCVLPKGAVIVGIYVDIQVASNATSTYDIGSQDDIADILAGTSAVTLGYRTGGTTTGTLFMTKLTKDTYISSSFTPNSSTTGGSGYVKLEYILLGPNESITD